MLFLKVFDFIKELDCFIVTDEYRRVADYLGLSEWNPVVWIGRLFILDNDYGEHWFDNWNLREEKKPAAEKSGFAYEELLIIDPDRFKNDRDGPCHPPELRKRFWTDVLRSLELSYDLLFEEARRSNERMKEILPEEYIEDLEQRIVQVIDSANQKKSSRG
ncbi:MAG: hypothetical protein L0229_15395 [Blastocatellia bacterium]|nr:hypothetical protein [Blastocatellia bacterium]